jgi:hypothetical protein
MMAPDSERVMLGEGRGSYLETAGDCHPAGIVPILRLNDEGLGLVSVIERWDPENGYPPNLIIDRDLWAEEYGCSDCTEYYRPIGRRSVRSLRSMMRRGRTFFIMPLQE